MEFYPPLCIYTMIHVTLTLVDTDFVIALNKHKALKLTVEVHLLALCIAVVQTQGTMYILLLLGSMINLIQLTRL